MFLEVASIAIPNVLMTELAPKSGVIVRLGVVEPLIVCALLNMLTTPDGPTVYSVFVAGSMDKFRKLTEGADIEREETLPLARLIWSNTRVVSCVAT